MEIKGFCLGAFRTNCYLVENDGEAFLVDPGDQAEDVIAYLKKLGCDLKAILITHGHIDHLGAAAAISEALGAEIVFPEKELDYLDNRTYPLMFETAGELQEFKDYVMQSGKGRLIADGAELSIAGVWIRAIEVPGHTDHSMVYHVPSEKVLFSGDTLFEASVGRTDMYAGDPFDLVVNIKEKLLTLPKDTIVLPGHSGATSIERESRQNPYLREVL